MINSYKYNNTPWMYEVICSVLLQEPVTQRFPRFEVCSLHFPNNQTQLQPSIKCVSKLYGINLNSIQMGVQVNPHVYIPFTSPHDPNTKQGAPLMQRQRHEIH